MSNKMIFGRTDFPHVSVLITLSIFINSANSIQFRVHFKNMKDTVEKYFPHENSLCVVLEECNIEERMPTFHVPVVVFTQDEVLHHCQSKSTNLDGYVLETTNAMNLEDQIVPLLGCFNQTTLKLQTKYILVVVFSKTGISDCEKAYSYFFHKLWKFFGIINIAILHVQDKIHDPPIIFSFNPFLAYTNLGPTALKRNSLTEDIRGIMRDRFHNMHGHRLKAAFFKDMTNSVNVESVYGKRTVGADPGILFKQVLEERLNVGFDFYESSDDKVFVNTNVTSMVGELRSGRAEYCVNLALSPPGVKLLNQNQQIPSGITIDMIFVVPKPKQIESWRYFQNIFQWQVCVGLGIVSLLLSGAALVFPYVHSKRSTFRPSSNETSEVVSVWKAAFSASINRLPSADSQRLLIACSLLLGLIFVTLFNVQLFALIKSKPRLASIKTFHDLHDSNLPIYTVYKTFSMYLDSFENTTLHRLKDNIKTDKMYEKFNFLNPRFLNITDRAIVCVRSLVELVASLPSSKAFLHYFEVVKEPIYQDTLTTFLPPGSVYFDFFNELNLRLVSGGFYLKWAKGKDRWIIENYAALSAFKAPQGEQATDDDRAPLTYDDMKMAFYILYVGLALSALCFLKEVLTFVHSDL